MAPRDLALIASRALELGAGGDDGANLPTSVVSRPKTAILKIASPLSNDHDVAMR